MVTATLKVGGASSNTYVDLAGGDRIFATGGDSRVEMQSQGAGKYEAEFNTAAADTEFLVDLQREEDDDAPASVGKLPGPFSMVVPNMTMSRAKDIVITWAPAGTNDAMTIELTGNCIFNPYHRRSRRSGDAHDHGRHAGVGQGGHARKLRRQRRDEAHAQRHGG
ncbi:MAG: hypothetical protein IPM54_41925 [Polyangiaceae bacterium]|nr:hypothetical protein [Polyangiaceae bacterium]